MPSLFTKYPYVFGGLLLLLIFFFSWKITGCENEQRRAKQQAVDQRIRTADSTMNTAAGRVQILEQQLARQADSTDYFRRKSLANSKNKQVIIQNHETIRTVYQRALSHNPDSARAVFLKQRFPDLYPN